MKESIGKRREAALRTECGREFSNVFQAIKLIRDEQHIFHVVYKTFGGEFIYSSCNPFQDTLAANTYKLISEPEAKHIFMPRLSPEHARELFSTAGAPVAARMHP